MKHKSWNGLQLFAAILLIPGCTNQSHQSESPSFGDNLGTFASRLINEMPERAFNDAKDTFTDSNNLLLLALAGGASIAMHNSDADRNLNENFQRHHGFNDTGDKIFDLAGHPGTHLAATGLWYLFSSADADTLNQQRVWTMISALAVTDSVTFGLKAIRNNERPNGEDWSWPSAHAASSFCAASVLDEFYGPNVGIPAYVGACFVGWRMMDSGDHWASDVLFGATLGYVVGHSVAGKHKLEFAGFDVIPTLATTYTPSAGISLLKRF